MTPHSTLVLLHHVVLCIHHSIEMRQQAKSQQPLLQTLMMPQPLLQLLPQSPVQLQPLLLPPLQHGMYVPQQHGSQLGLTIDQLPSARHARTTVGSATTVPAPRPPSQLTVAAVRCSGSALS